MRVHNIRLGFACNSSSDHTLLIGEKGIVCDHPDQFGWDFFTAACKGCKEKYINYVLYSNLYRIVQDEEEAKKLTERYTGKSVPSFFCGVDHQSIPYFPTTWDGTWLDMEFYNAYRKFMLREDVVILGGNDNTSEEHPLGRGKKIPYELYHYALYNSVARNDGTHWVLFSRINGTKIRFSFDDLKESALTIYPEMIDLKITDYCTFGCKWCYQDSTPQGKHARIQDISSLAWDLHYHKIFEVAIGGGEPTMHPEFVEILKLFRSYHIVPNFTTRNLKWIKGFDFDLIGRFAYSVNERKDVDRLMGEVIHYGVPKGKVAIQYVVGTSSDYMLQYIMESAAYYNIPLILLAYKPVGRGHNYKLRYTNSNWVDYWVKTKCTLGVDVPLARQYDEEIKAAGVNGWLYRTRDENLFVDMVDYKIGRNSYDAPLHQYNVALLDKWLTTPVGEDDPV